MLKPIRNRFRDYLPLDGLWTFRADPDDAGEQLGWFAGFAPECDYAVPGSVHEQLAERGYRDYFGAVWVQCRVRWRQPRPDQSLTLRLNSADLCAKAWCNGVLLGEHALPFLPVDFPLDNALADDALVVIRLDNRLPAEHPLPGISMETYRAQNRPREETYPPVRYDFFPYLGLHRSPLWVVTPVAGFEQVDADVDFDAATQLGTAQLRLSHSATRPLRAVATLRASDGNVVASAAVVVMPGTAAMLTLQVPNAAPWAPASPTLYRLEAELHDGDVPVDAYQREIGLRRVRVQGMALMLNDAPIRLRGFGMHEDFPVLGKGQLLALTIKDFELLRWIGANSIRTSHYAYAEETLELADRRGILVISEVASVNLDFRDVSTHTLALHCTMIERQIQRDRSHPCVIAWSLTNEPGYLAEAEYASRAGAYFTDLFAHARALDATRPLTAANVGGRHGLNDPLYDHVDFLALNRYLGWYEAPAQIGRAIAMLAAECDELAARYRKPLFLSEFGADAIPGLHATSAQLFSEEYQADLIAAYWALIERHPALIGGHVWNFADFRTAQHHRRVALNHKGVFSRVRDPKMAAWRLRSLWQSDPSKDAE